MTVVLDSRLHDVARPLSGSSEDYDPLFRLIGDSAVVMIGEASHGTHEFYRERARITRRLITDHGFDAVAVEADWPDAWRVNRYVRGEGDDHSAEESLRGFRRFPHWMWRNADVLDFVSWLRDYNDSLPARIDRVGFYGLDLYSLHTSIEAVIDYLDKVDPIAATRARQRYACFDHFGGTDDYALKTGLGVSDSCEREVVEQLVDLRRNLATYASRDGRIPPDEWFYASENARLVRNAEEYYRAMFRGHPSTWNLRDHHMAETLEALRRHLNHGGRKKFVVWEHNSHVGDARATERSKLGEWTMGQLGRQLYGDDVVLVGFSGYGGTVTAASEWDGPAERKLVRPALEGSWEDLLYGIDIPRLLIILRDKAGIRELNDWRLQRAIGVVYLPETERQSHYYRTRLARQFDAVIHFDETRAVEPLERTPLWERGELPETWPSGL